MKKFLLAPLLAALAMFFWGFVFWALLPFPYSTVKTAPDAAIAALQATFPESGTYLIPSPHTPDEALIAEQAKRGPSATIHLVKEGMDPMPPSMLLTGYLHELVSCLLLAFLMHKAAPSFKGYWGRVQFSVGVGLLIAIFGNLSDPIWWHHPWGLHLVTALYTTVAWLVAGLVLAKFHTPKAG